MERYSSPISYFWGVLCTLLGALSLNDIVIIVGIILSIVTFINNITQNISFGEGQDNKEAANETARMLKQAVRSVIQEKQRPVKPLILLKFFECF